jgi:hypothetical protein
MSIFPCARWNDLLLMDFHQHRRTTSTSTTNDDGSQDERKEKKKWLVYVQMGGGGMIPKGMINFHVQLRFYPWQVLRRTDAKTYEKKVRNYDILFWPPASGHNLIATVRRRTHNYSASHVSGVCCCARMRAVPFLYIIYKGPSFSHSTFVTELHKYNRYRCIKLTMLSQQNDTYKRDTGIANRLHISKPLQP